MQPNPSKVDRNVPNSPAQPPERRPSSDGIRRVDSDVRRIDDPFALSAITMSIGSSSGVSGSASQQRREQAPLSKDFATAGISDTGYGSTSTAQVDTKL
jgi:hypothetical protein